MEEDQQSDEETPASGHEKNSKTPITKTGENFENSFDDSQDASGEGATGEGTGGEARELTEGAGGANHTSSGGGRTDQSEG